MTSPIHLACPCCGARLTVEPGTGEVLAVDPGPKVSKSFDAAMGDVQAAPRRREDAFSKAFDRTRRLEDLLEKKFEEARKKASEDPSAPRNPFDAD